ncbi:MAG: hypothetical protein ABDI07_07120 [Candidatus Kryptonium sp.]
MRIKKFRAKNMFEALRKVKEEFGEEAVIIDSGKIKEDGRDLYEVVAAIEEKETTISLSECDFNSAIFGASKISSNQEILKELQDIKLLLKNLLVNQDQGVINLLREGVPEDLAKEINSFNGSLRDFILNKWRKKGVNPISRLQVFIGEAGVGKTTALYKVAFWFKYYRKKKVAVIETDNYKVGAREQAQRLSKLLEIPLYLADWDELSRDISAYLEKYDFIFFDTPNLGRRFSLHELEEIYNLLPSLRFYWVARTTDHWEHTFEIWEELRVLPIEGLILTFVDKYQRGYRLFWLLQDEIPPPVFISNGDRIPEDIEKVTEDKLLEILTRGIKDSKNL